MYFLFQPGRAPFSYQPQKIRPKKTCIVVQWCLPNFCSLGPSSGKILNFSQHFFGIFPEWGGLSCTNTVKDSITVFLQIITINMLETKILKTQCKACSWKNQAKSLFWSQIASIIEKLILNIYLEPIMFFDNFANGLMHVCHHIIGRNQPAKNAQNSSYSIQHLNSSYIIQHLTF